VDLNQNNYDVTYVGWTDGAGNCNPSTNAIDKANVAVGDAVYYIYSTSTTGHYSVHSAQDGVVVGLSSVAIIDNDLMGNISPNDSLEITFTGNVDIPISSSAISGGQALLGAGNYQWNAVLQDINVAPVSVGSAAVINGEGFWLKNSTNSNKVYIDLNFANHSVGVIQQYQVEIKPNGTNTILSSSGGHCVLPKTTITASGTTGGERTPDF
jgi:hypothetical protein